MQLIRFRVQMYKSCQDSGWVDVSAVTALVGRNETGKTTLLKALHKFRPFKAEPYSLNREWPRGFRGQKDEKQRVCTCEFILSVEERDYLNTITGQRFYADTVQIAVNYAGGYELLLRDGIVGHQDTLLKNSVTEYLVARIPTFVYLDEYGTFRGSAILDQLKQRRDHHQLTEDDKTFLTILDLSRLDLDKLVEMGAEEDREDRQYDLDDAAGALTKLIEDHWGQLRYEVKFGADGQQFFTWVKDANERSLIRLEERSRGFQWFFSFDLLLMQETKGTFKNCVILLDEPGMYLHPEGQKDLLARLKVHSKENTLIFTTHLPFLIDLEQPDSLRSIANTGEGTIVFNGLRSDGDADITVETAILSGIASGLMAADQTLLVEDGDDALILSELSNLLVRSGEEGFVEGLQIIPGGSAKQTVYRAALLTARKKKLLVLFHTDLEGVAAKEKIERHWLNKFESHYTTVWDYGHAIGEAQGDYGPEDLFSEAYYLVLVEEVFAKSLAFADVKEIRLRSGGRVRNRAREFFSERNISFDSSAVARRLASVLRRMPNAESLPEETRRRIKTLVMMCNQHFANDAAVERTSAEKNRETPGNSGLLERRNWESQKSDPRPSSMLNLTVSLQNSSAASVMGAPAEPELPEKPLAREGRKNGRDDKNSGLREWLSNKLQ